MGGAIGDILPLALGVAISPTPIIVVILMLLSTRAAGNGLAFLAGWATGVTTITVVILAVAESAIARSDRTAPDWVTFLEIVIGAGLVLFGAYTLRGRHPRNAAAMPKWMTAVESVTPVKAFVMGAAFAAVNPKSIAMAFGVGASMLRVSLDEAERVVVVLVFVAMSSASIAAPVAYYLVGGDHAKSTLDSWRSWLVVNTDVVMAVVMILFGAVLIGKGLAA